jgi:MFS family permease
METMAGNNIPSSEVREFRRRDYVKVNIFGFALNALWNPMSTTIMPLLVLDFVAESQKNTYLGIITFVGLVLAIIVQPVAGAISDQSNFTWGRRRPYILLGSILSILLLMSMGFANSLIAVLLIYCLLQISSNIAHGPWQGFIPDLVPDNKRGIASGVKGIVELLGAVAGIQVTGYFLSQRFAAEEDIKLFLALGMIAIIMAGAMLATVLTVKEKPGAGSTKFPIAQTLHNAFKIDVRANTSFIFFLVSRFLFLMPLIVVRTFGLYFLKDVVRILDPVAMTSDLMVVVGVSLLIVVYPAGYLADRIGRRPIVIASGLISAFGFVILLFFHAYFYIMLAGALLGIANGGFMSANWAMATDLVAKDEEARYLGLTNLATGGACAIAAFAGPIIDILNTYGTNLGYQVVFVSCILFPIISSILVLKIKTR